MRGVYLIAALLCAAFALAVPSARAQDQATPSVGQLSAAEPGPPSPAVDPVVALIRTNLADPILRKGANPDDLAALETLYKAGAGGPLWMTDMGLSAKGLRALSEIAQADDWGLAASAFDLPSEGELPANPEAEALAEVKLDLAILKYARFARGGRLNPLHPDDKLYPGPAGARSERGLSGDHCLRCARQLSPIAPSKA